MRYANGQEETGIWENGVLPNQTPDQQGGADTPAQQTDPDTEAVQPVPSGE